MRTLLDYTHQSAPAELAAQLAAALAASPGGSAADSGGCLVPAEGLVALLEVGGAEDEEACTDSDDESSEDVDRPSGSAAAVNNNSCASPDVDAAAAAAVASVSSCVLQLGGRLTAALNWRGGIHAGSMPFALHAASSMESECVTLLRTALHAVGDEMAPVGVHNLDDASPSLRTTRLQKQQIAAVATAASQLLSRLNPVAAAAIASGRSGVHQNRSAITGAIAAAGSSSSSSSSNAVGTDVTITATAASTSAGNGYNNTSSDDAPVGVTPALTADEATLAAAPGVIDLLRQLVAQHAALERAIALAAAARQQAAASTALRGGAGSGAGVACESAATLLVGGSCASGHVRKAGKGKSKCRRRLGAARYGNPDILRAARAKADARLAVVLPELQMGCVSTHMSNSNLLFKRRSLLLECKHMCECLCMCAHTCRQAVAACADPPVCCCCCCCHCAGCRKLAVPAATAISSRLTCQPLRTRAAAEAAEAVVVAMQ